MSEKPDNPPAFPQAPAVGPAGDVYHSGQMCPGSDGMSLRDWFAGQVTPITWQQSTVMANLGRIDDENVARVAAGMAYLLADALLAERAEGGAA